MVEKSRKIESLQALRFIALLGIIMSHFGMRISWAYLGVAVFFVLSGFLSGIKNDESKAEGFISIKNACQRIKKLYVIHLITMSAVLLLSLFIIFVNKDFKTLPTLLWNTVFNIFLVQSWIPDSNIANSLNGVAWFLSSLFFILIFEPVLLRLAKKIKKTWINAAGIGLVLFIQIFLAGAAYMISAGFFEWFTYHGPIFRMCDFFIGILLGRLFAKKRIHKKDNFALGNVIEIIVFAAVIAFHIFIKKIPGKAAKDILFNKATPYVFLAALLIMIFALNKGILTKLLTNKVTVFFGNISGYMFLIHYAVLIFTNKAFGYFDIELAGVLKAVVFILETFFSINLSALCYFLNRGRNGK